MKGDQTLKKEEGSAAPSGELSRGQAKKGDMARTIPAGKNAITVQAHTGMMAAKRQSVPVAKQKPNQEVLGSVLFLNFTPTGSGIPTVRLYIYRYRSGGVTGTIRTPRFRMTPLYPRVGPQKIILFRTVSGSGSLQANNRIYASGPA
jgi:hypothetical protein